MIANKTIITITTLFTLIFVTASSGFAQEKPVPEVSILESRFSTTEPIVSETFQYFLKFDHKADVNIHLVEHFSDNGFIVVEQKPLEPQTFQGRIIQQHEYTLRAEQTGQYVFIPVSIHYVGPLKNSLAAQPEPTQVTVLPIVDVQVVTNSPIMLNESLELSLSVTTRKPVTITSMPDTIEATLQVPAQPDTGGQEEASSPTPSPIPEPPGLRFELDRSQRITPQQTDGQIVEQYRYTVVVPPEQIGEYVIPEMSLSYRSATGEEIQVHTEETRIFVLNPNTGNLAIQTDYRFLIFPAIVVAAMLLAGLVGLLYLKYRKPRTRKEAIIEPPLPPGELAYRELAQIRALKLPAKGEFKMYYTMVSEAVRKFLGAEFGFHVLERTTEEVIQDIRKRDVPESIREDTGRFLREADMVKFAKYIPLLEEADTAMDQALTIVDKSVEYHQAKTKAEAMVGEHVGDSPELVSES
jgi:hypothetical protein